MCGQFIHPRANSPIPEIAIEMSAPQASLLPDGQRLHLHHGPIDLIIEVTGPGRNAAYQRAISRFSNVLEELVAELPMLREQARTGTSFKGSISQEMQNSVEPYCANFITPMAAVAGAVADDILIHLCNGTGIDKAYVNNGGDVAFHITPGQTVNAAIAGHPSGRITIHSHDPFRGIATSGWRGRSFSFGIADAVSVVAKNSAMADVAATMIANAVNLPNDPIIERLPATDISPDSDLGKLRITTNVPPLSSIQIMQALDNGKKLARSLLERNLIGGACLQLSGYTQHIGQFSIQRSHQTPQISQELINA